MAKIVSLGINTVEMSHAARQIRIRGLYHQMVMGWHQTKGSHVDIEQICGLLKQFDKLLMIRFIDKKVFSPSGTVHHMMPGIRIVYSQRPRHGLYIPELI